jgi:DNA-binding beta-propeller fold protein YncE
MKVPFTGLTLCFALWLAAPVSGAEPPPPSQAAGTVIAVDKVGNKIRFLDARSLAEVAHIDPPGLTVHELALGPDHRRAYVPLYGNGIYGANTEPNNKILVIDLQARTITRVIDLGSYVAPHGLQARRDGKLWAVCDQQNKLLLIDPSDGSVESAYDVPGKGAHFIALSPDEGRIYVSNKEGAAQVFDTRTHAFSTLLSAAPAGATPGNGTGFEGLALSPDGGRVFIADNASSAIHSIDARTGKQLESVALRGLALTNPKRSRLVKLIVSADGRTLVATAYASGQAWIIDAHRLRRQMLVAVAKGPQGAAFDPDGHSVIIASHDSGLLTRVDLRTGQPLAAYDGGNGIESLAFY